MDKMDKYVDEIAKHWKILAAALGTVLVVLAVVGLWRDMQNRKNREATNFLYEAQTLARKSVEAKQPEEAVKAFASLLEKYPGTRAAFEARLQAGDIWMDAGNFEKAAESYQAAVKDASDSFGKVLSYYTLGVAHETAGKLQEAVNSYDEALKLQGSDFLRPEILMAQARCFEALKQPAKAIEIYKTVQDKFASRSYYSGAASVYEKQLSALDQAPDQTKM